MTLDEFNIIQNYPAFQRWKLVGKILNSCIYDSESDLQALNRVFEKLGSKIEYIMAASKKQGELFVFFGCRGLFDDLDVVIGCDFEKITLERSGLNQCRTTLHIKDLQAIDAFVDQIVPAENHKSIQA